jgi:hypothetical protein
MKSKRIVIETANAALKEAGLPAYDDLVVLLRAAENKLGAMQAYHAGPARQAIASMRRKLAQAVDGIPGTE